MAGRLAAASRRGQGALSLVSILGGVSALFLFGGRGVLPQATVARAGAATPATSAPAGGVLYLPAGAHAAGANGANWRTDVEVHNPGSSTASFAVQLLRADADNSSPASRSYTLAAGRSRRFADVLVSEFGFEGAAALRVSVTSGTLVMTSRTYNLLGANPWNLPMGASFGLFEPGIAESDALSYGQEGRIIQLTQQPSSSLNGFRTNVTFVNTTASPIDVHAEFYRADGTYLGTKDGGDTNLPAYGFRQLNEVLGTWGTVADGYAIVRTTTAGGGLIAFATVIDNHYSGDPIFIPAAKVSGAGTTPTPTPTATPPSGARPNLYLYKPSGWASCLSANNQTGCCTNTSCCSPFLSTSSSAFLQMYVANNGQATLTGPVRFALSIDGVVGGYANWPNSSGLEPGYGVVVTWEYTNPVAAGTHTLTLTVDPDNTIAETNEGDNTCASSATWISVMYGHGQVERALSAPAGEDQVSGGHPVAVRERLRPLTVEARSALAAGAAEPIYVPGSAHASGMNGSNWRTDLEVHNPGATVVTYSIALLKQSTDNGGSVPTQTFSLGPQQSVRYVDVLSTVFSTDGAAALRVMAQSGALLVNSRTYNLIGTNSVGLPVGASFGQFVPGLAESEAIGYGEEGRIIQLTHRDASTGADFRSNAGFVNTTASPIDLRIDLMGSDGGLLATIQDDRTHLRPYETKQINGIFGEATSWLEDGYAIVRSMTPEGRFFAFATVIDNHVTGDPIFVPAVKLPRSVLPTPTPTPTPTPSGDVVTGPGGTSITLPTGGRTPGAAVTITTGNGAALAKTGETLVSTVIAIGVGGEGSTTGAGPFVVRIPVTGAVSDPSKLLLKVQTNVGPVYPVAGVYDAGSKTFTAELQGLWNGWNMGVVTNPSLQILAPAGSGVGGPGTLGWVTPDDWQTCGWGVVDDRPKPLPAAGLTYAADVQKALGKACDHLRGAQFRSPKLWINSTENPKARVAHVVSGTGPNDPTTSFSHALSEDKATFSMVGYNDVQMQSLGQLYFNWDDVTNLFVPSVWSTGNIAIHELLHAVQTGYDIRDDWWKNGDTWEHALMWLMEGNSTVVGMTYQMNLNGIWGGDVTVRPQEPPETLDSILQMWAGVWAYARQDFFAYVAKRYNGGSFLDLRNLYQDLSDQTNGQFGKTEDEYRTLYRRAMDIHYGQAFGVTLPDLYTEFVLDRAYRHTEPALLRNADFTLPKNSLDKKVFDYLASWDPSAKASISITEGPLSGGLQSLQTWAISASVPAAAQTAGKLDLQFTVTGAPVSHTGVRIFVFRESNGVMVSGGDQEVTDVSKPVSVPVGASTQTLTILVVNGSVENTPAQVTVSTTATPAPLFKHAQISFYAAGTFHNSIFGQHQQIVQIGNIDYNSTNTCIGTYTGSTFSCTWSGSEPKSTGRITLVFNSKYDTVQTFAFDEVDTFTDGSTSSEGLTGGNIPLAPSPGAAFVLFAVSGSDACSHVTSATFSETLPFPLETNTLVSYSCDGNSYLDIRLYP